jgi:hypothetical protein
MRDMQKFKRDQKNGLIVGRNYAPSKGLETSIVSRTIARALRRGRITQDMARRCALNWVSQLNARPKHQVWSRVAARELLEVAILRRRGNTPTHDTHWQPCVSPTSAPCRLSRKPSSLLPGPLWARSVWYVPALGSPVRATPCPHAHYPQHAKGCGPLIVMRISWLYEHEDISYI